MAVTKRNKNSSTTKKGWLYKVVITIIITQKNTTQKFHLIQFSKDNDDAHPEEKVDDGNASDKNNESYQGVGIRLLTVSLLFIN